VNIIQPFQFLNEAFVRTLLSHRRAGSRRGVLLFQPTRAEALIVSSVRYTAQFKKIKNPPRIPRLGVIEREPAGPARLARAALAAQDAAAEDQFIPAEEHEVVLED
jgi:hypothetical protein